MINDGLKLAGEKPELEDEDNGRHSSAATTEIGDAELDNQKEDDDVQDVQEKDTPTETEDAEKRTPCNAAKPPNPPEEIKSRKRKGSQTPVSTNNGKEKRAKKLLTDAEEWNVSDSGEESDSILLTHPLTQVKEKKVMANPANNLRKRPARSLPISDFEDEEEEEENRKKKRTADNNQSDKGEKEKKTTGNKNKTVHETQEWELDDSDAADDPLPQDSQDLL